MRWLHPEALRASSSTSPLSRSSPQTLHLQPHLPRHQTPTSAVSVLLNLQGSNNPFTGFHYQIFTLWFLTVAELQIRSSNRDNVMIGGSP